MNITIKYFHALFSKNATREEYDPNPPKGLTKIPYKTISPL
jgi:hypothetical protein